MVKFDLESYKQYLKNQKKYKLEFEDENFHINSKGWKKITAEGKEYLENPEGDIWEILEKGKYKGEQLYTWDAAMREVAKANKIMPSSKEFTELLKRKLGMPNLIFVGIRNAIGSSKYTTGNVAAFWSSTDRGANAWSRGFYSNFGTGISWKARTHCKKNGYSVRCLKN